MKSILTKLILLASAPLFLSACTLPLIGNQNAGTQITSTPQANVFFDNQNLGQTPIIKQDLKPGSHTIKISSPDPNILPWEGLVTFNSGVVTIIDRQLSADPSQSTGYILSFEKIPDKKSSEINIITTQDNVTVSIDGAPSGFTPLKSNSISPGAHVFVLTSPGFQDKTIKASVQLGYRLIINAELASQTIIPVATDLLPSPSATPSAATSPTKTPSISPSPTTAVTDITPLPKQSTASAATKPYVEILTTPTGFLRVRDTAGASGTEVAKVNPGDRFPYVDVSTIAPYDWYQIEYQTGKKGWVSGQYSKLVK